jgi:hypothetical protein
VYEPSAALGGQRAAAAVLPAAAFSAAGGALADLESAPEAATLRANAAAMVARVNALYAPCCIWFALGKVWAVDPAKARISRDGTTLAAFTGTTDEGEPRVSGDRLVETAEGSIRLLGALQRFRTDHAGLPASRCLALLLARGFEGEAACAGIAQQGGDHCGCDLSNLSLRSSGFVVAHELGHNLGLGHWTADEPDPYRINVMRERASGIGGARPYFSPEQCQTLRARALAIGAQEAPPPPPQPAEPAAPPPRQPGDPQPAPAPAPPAGADRPPARPPEERQRCPCPTPTVRVEGLAALRALGRGDSGEGRAVFETCCARVTLVTKVTHEPSGRYSLEWALELEVLVPECFLGMDLDRYYNSKKLEFVGPGGGTVSYAVQVGSVRMAPAGPGRWRLDGDAGFSRDYTGVPARFSEQRLQPGADASLSRLRGVQDWQVLLGGVVRCRDGDAVRELPFVLETAMARGGALTLHALGSREPATPPAKMVRKVLATVR